MTDWKSISVTEEQKAALQAHKPENVAMGKFLVDVIDDDTDVPSAASQSIPSSVENDTSDMQDRLDRIESGVREATNAAQSADKKLEGFVRIRKQMENRDYESVDVERYLK